MKKNLLYVAIGLFLILFVVWLSHALYLKYSKVSLAYNSSTPGWRSGSVFHILPTVNHDRILIKVSFTKLFEEPPILSIDNRQIYGRKTDTQGYFWQFDAPNLKPKTTYQLVIQDKDGVSLCDPWPLSTFPAPNDQPKSLRLLIFTGLGGHDANIEGFGTGPLPLAVRIRLLNKALSFKPDALISSGDQIYYDLMYDKSSAIQGNAPRAKRFSGVFDRSLPVLGTKNEDVLKKAVGPQIAYLYGAACRSIPTFFILDDHDYFENDIATKDKWLFDIRLLGILGRNPFYKGGISFPPDNFMLDLARSAQNLYLPEFLPDVRRPQDIPGTGAPDRASGVSESYGTLRYGKLFEGLLFESRRFVTLTGEDAVFIHPKAEQWLIGRMKAEETTHVVNIPAVVFGWSAGKWMEWYPDILEDDGKLTTSKQKYMWQKGWFLQHNRILKAASSMKKAVPLFICGDLHSLAEGLIYRSGNLDLSANPVISVVSGSLGTGSRSFPGSFRGTVGQPSKLLKMQERLACVEKNGFVVVDLMPDRMIIKFYSWRPPEPIDAIDKLEPFHVLEIKVPKK